MGSIWYAFKCGKNAEIIFLFSTLERGPSKWLCRWSRFDSTKMFIVYYDVLLLTPRDYFTYMVYTSILNVREFRFYLFSAVPLRLIMLITYIHVYVYIYSYSRVMVVFFYTIFIRSSPNFITNY